ncbi:hypothetical protein QVD17_17220 [Tagetes erecta]|uniref:Cytochrome P450 n=1 Tax=Tagetes erecta TaxID=13708 RepID=A0AAD8P191_TARER|nr:hypothetical protein QVD17_17220 [Tagetes erecta]
MTQPTFKASNHPFFVIHVDEFLPKIKTANKGKLTAFKRPRKPKTTLSPLNVYFLTEASTPKKNKMILPLLLLCFLLPLIFIFFNTKSYPLIGDYISIYTNRHRLIQFLSDAVLSSPNHTVVLRRPFGPSRVITGNPAVVQHILKTKFSTYQKGENFRAALFDVLGDGIFNVDGDKWKFQRQLSNPMFNTKSLRHFVEHVVDTELNERLIPILATAADNNTVIDLQDVLQRFAFDNICQIAFGYDPACLTPSLPHASFAVAFEDAIRLCTERVRTSSPIIWKIKRFLNIGSEKQLKKAVSEIRQLAVKIVNQRKQEMKTMGCDKSVDLLSGFISAGYTDDRFLMDIVVSFIFAGRDTTSAALTWFFWLIYKNPTVETEIVNEINRKPNLDTLVYDEVKEMVYTHASICESMRLYPPVPIDGKMAINDDVLPDGTVVKKGMTVSYHPYAMGRSEKLWGEDWSEFRPERWLEEDEVTETVRFVARDAYTYPVFQAGPRMCSGKDMAFLQMKRVVAGVLRRFVVVPVVEDGCGEPVFVASLTSKMKGGFRVTIKERN